METYFKTCAKSSMSIEKFTFGKVILFKEKKHLCNLPLY